MSCKYGLNVTIKLFFGEPTEPSAFIRVNATHDLALMPWAGSHTVGIKNIRNQISFP